MILWFSPLVLVKIGNTYHRIGLQNEVMTNRLIHTSIAKYEATTMYPHYNILQFGVWGILGVYVHGNWCRRSIVHL